MDARDAMDASDAQRVQSAIISYWKLMFDIWNEFDDGVDAGRYRRRRRRRRHRRQVRK